MLMDGPVIILEMDEDHGVDSARLQGVHQVCNACIPARAKLVHQHRSVLLLCKKGTPPT